MTTSARLSLAAMLAVCAAQPSIATDGSGTVLLTWQNLLLTGSDVFYGESMARSTDNGRTFAPGRDQHLDADHI